MVTKLSQAVVDRCMEEVGAGKQLYDTQVKGFRVVVGKRSASYKLVTGINDGTGRVVSVMIGRTDEVSLKTARQLATEANVAARRGEDPRRLKSTAPTVREAMERHVATKSLRPTTVDWYRHQTEVHLKKVADMPMDKLDRETCRSLHERLTKDVSPTTANGALRVLKALYNDVARTMDLPPNPVSLAVRMHKDKERDWAVEPKDMAEAWKAIDGIENPVMRAAWATMMLTGLRANDVRNLRWDDIDENGVAFIREPKGGESRAFRLPLPRAVLDEIEALRSWSPWVFPAKSRSGHIESFKRKGGFWLSPHMCRHTYRSFCAMTGVPLEVCMALMNHKGQGVTFRYVTRAALEETMRVQAERVAEAMLAYREMDSALV
ncbi:tyrosine-type recombinase/integrase [Parvularcula maris]|uniref:Tyrosine-type recombinase/integrase n=1 Tax=Parvularcula maris TaxID=2965077 RepID=A0A9X2LDA2_9PROT|nr:tyrosine-type recombinase/integrase [Parvularcula maris]